MSALDKLAAALRSLSDKAEGRWKSFINGKITPNPKDRVKH